jgi:hypothetical protein
LRVAVGPPRTDLFSAKNSLVGRAGGIPRRPGSLANFLILQVIGISPLKLDSRMVFEESTKSEAQTTLPNLRVEPTFFSEEPNSSD